MLAPWFIASAEGQLCLNKAVTLSGSQMRPPGQRRCLLRGESLQLVLVKIKGVILVKGPFSLESVFSMHFKMKIKLHVYGPAWKN